MYAIIESGGKQYRVEKGDVIKVEKLDVLPKKKVTFDKVLLVSDKETVIGTPTVEGAKVTGTVEEQGRDKKVIVYKYKPKKGFHKKRGHRQPFTLVTIDKIETKATKSASSKAAEADNSKESTAKKTTAKKTEAKSEGAKKTATKSTTAKKTTTKAASTKKTTVKSESKTTTEKKTTTKKAAPKKTEKKDD